MRAPSCFHVKRGLFRSSLTLWGKAPAFSRYKDLHRSLFSHFLSFFALSRVAGDISESFFFAVLYLVTGSTAQLWDRFLSWLCWGASSLGSAALELSDLDFSLRWACYNNNVIVWSENGRFTITERDASPHVCLAVWSRGVLPCLNFCIRHFAHGLSFGITWLHRRFSPSSDLT